MKIDLERSCTFASRFNSKFIHHVSLVKTARKREGSDKRHLSIGRCSLFRLKKEFCFIEAEDALISIVRQKPIKKTFQRALDHFSISEGRAQSSRAEQVAKVFIFNSIREMNTSPGSSLLRQAVSFT